MKHIKEILAAKRAALFAERSQEKGSREWQAFNAVAGDRVELFPSSTSQPSKIRRYTAYPARRQLSLRFGH